MHSPPMSPRIRVYVNCNEISMFQLPVCDSGYEERGDSEYGGEYGLSRAIGLIGDQRDRNLLPNSTPPFWTSLLWNAAVLQQYCM